MLLAAVSIGLAWYTWKSDQPIAIYKRPVAHIMKSYDVIIAGTVRNVEKYIEKSLRNVDRCGALFKSYQVVVYENDSSDKTREILQRVKRDNYHYIFEDGITEKRRAVRIANGRNKILEAVRGMKADLLIMLDLDDRNESGRFVETIETCFYNEDWDVVSANQSDTYYDLWALRKECVLDYDFSLQIAKIQKAESKEAGDQWYKALNDSIHFEPGYLVPVKSAFGAAAIYRLRSIPSSCRYVGSYEFGPHQGTEQCEHVEFHRCIGGRRYINSSFYTA